MNVLGHLTVLPDIPERIGRLEDLSRNLYWTWHPDARRLFRHLDRELWEAVGHSPPAMLRDISQAKLEAAARDEGYLALYDEVIAGFERYLKRQRTWFRERSSGRPEDVYAYFCMEYGWHEAVALYSGGLGVLAGDHTKAASDLGVPLVAVGPWFPEGYFHQRVAQTGEQEAYYERLSPSDMPFTLAKTAAGDEARVSVALQGREVFLRAWHLAVGTVSVYLLDTDVPENSPEDRGIFSRLYGGDQRTRIAQEILLGIGGVRLLRALGISPTAWHMNEGHSAFMPLERCRELVESGLPFDQAREVVAAGTLFTVHTPVAAGNDTFPFDLINQFFSGFWGALGLSQGQFHELGRHDHGWGPVFSMPALALRFSSGRNGVAKLHGETSREIWRDLWPEVPTEEVPITHITNGVHAPTWVAPEIRELVGKVLPEGWQERFDDAEMWAKVRELDSAELWAVRQTLKADSIDFFRARLAKQRTRHGATKAALRVAETLFSTNTLTIGFARRFATYKRATLIFRDLDRLARILGDPDRPVQLVFAGKAHPADKPGQALITTIQSLSQDPRFLGKILFIEDYDMAVGRAMTRGVDVWLNNPRRPLEASGTSGQKAAMNGVLNLSILDGWWPEGFDGENGWAIGTGDSAAASELADEADADALYDLLEHEVIPLYYDRDAAGVPQRWLERAKNAIATISPAFNARRMVKEYVETFYAPASERARRFGANNFAVAAELAAWRHRVQNAWHNLYVSAKPLTTRSARVGEPLEIEVTLHPRDLADEALCVELVYSAEADRLERGLHHVRLECAQTFDDGGRLYRACFHPEVSGQLVYGVRVYPLNEHLVSPFDAYAIRWA
ncbi:alpha-glucan family phosphorylase [Truepera radiovictrix]|uniref:Alpha-glucan phosphorylase n=1 Tax=Truepera radiovictrix (strain DSM 17093 / CIP 108686 / LMG 22925 / RQ-24) TaxID=649638 RepID=D7CQE6_TRURR|nr:alpha-glucan family phosphorylase [Truepera radiovictrix]ADI14930.1 alpha-glucan phosphorylase [Truepera radiovictrix DSM 17093]WMT56516.1 alpha-glucan family phosphorylase [Truepera radiovictrix]